MRLYVTSNPRMRFSVKCAFPHLGKRGVASRKSAFWQVGSRKSALCGCGVTEKRSLARAHRARLTEKRTLLAWSSQNASFRDVKPQNAPFRRMRFSSPGQTRRRLTEKRILAGYLTEKRTLARARRAHLTEKRTLHMTAHSTSPSGIVELCKPGGRPRALRRAFPLRTAVPCPPPTSAPCLPSVACATM